MTFAEFQKRVAMDLYRYERVLSARGFLTAFVREPGFRLTVLMRLCALFRAHPLTRFGMYHFFFVWFRRCSIRFGVSIDFTMQIGGGLYIPHAISIVMNRKAVIGENCNLSQNVTIGVAQRGPRKGNPVIGDKVYIGPGAVIIGNIRIGDRCAIGANCVVTRDAPDDSVVAGVPGKIISAKGSQGFVNNVLGEDIDSDHTG